MIESLKGSHETVLYHDESSIKLYDNVQYEAYPRHWHTAVEIIMPTEGSYSLEYGGNQVVMQEQEILLICPGALHSINACEGKRYIFQAEVNAVAKLRSTDSLLTMIYPGLLVTPKNSPYTYDRIRQLMLEIVEECHQSDVFYDASVYGKVLEMMVQIRRGQAVKTSLLGANESKQKEYMEKFTEVCNYINDHCTEPLTLDEIATIAGFSKYHFTRLFKQFANTSFYKYLNQKRIEQAERLLINPQLSITEVSLASGFSSLSAFIRMFRLLKGCTPTEYRAMYNL